MLGYLTGCCFTFITSFNFQPPWKVGVAVTILHRRKLRYMEEKWLTHITQLVSSRAWPLWLQSPYLSTILVSYQICWKVKDVLGSKMTVKSLGSWGIQNSDIMSTQETEVARRRKAVSTDQWRELTYWIYHAWFSNPSHSMWNHGSHRAMPLSEAEILEWRCWDMSVCISELRSEYLLLSSCKLVHIQFSARNCAERCSLWSQHSSKQMIDILSQCINIYDFFSYCC